MINEIKNVIKSKIQEIGFHFDVNELFKKEMISISFSMEDSVRFPTYNCRYYSDSQKSGAFDFQIRFSIENRYFEVDVNDVLDLTPDIEIHILLFKSHHVLTFK